MTRSCEYFCPRSVGVANYDRNAQEIFVKQCELHAHALFNNYMYVSRGMYVYLHFMQVCTYKTYISKQTIVF